jgi:hypothetical protein
VKVYDLKYPITDDNIAEFCEYVYNLYKHKVIYTISKSIPSGYIQYDVNLIVEHGVSSLLFVIKGDQIRQIRQNNSLHDYTEAIRIFNRHRSLEKLLD